jgi:hypothetical protein
MKMMTSNKGWMANTLYLQILYNTGSFSQVLQYVFEKFISTEIFLTN